MVGAMYTSYNVVSGAYKQVTDKAKISSSSRDLVTMIMRDIRMAILISRIIIVTKSLLDELIFALSVTCLYAPLTTL